MRKEKKKSSLFDMLQSGSDLFIPGVHRVMGELKKGKPAAVEVGGAVYGVGICLVNQEDLGEMKEGSAFYLVHYYGDHLWQLGSKKSPPLQLQSESESEEEEEEQQQEQKEQEQEEQEQEEKEKVEEEKVLNEPLENDSSSNNNNNDEEKEESEKDLMDRLLEETFIRGLRLFVQKNDLPMLLSTFYSKCMIPSCPEGKEIDLKKSSYKKISVLADFMEKNEVVKCQMNEKKALEIVDINRSSMFYRKFKVDDVKPDDSESVTAPPTVELLYGIPKRMSNVFEIQSGLTKKEARNVLLKHIKDLNLLCADKSGKVNVDDDLRKLLKGAKEVMKMNELVDLWFECIDSYYKVYVGSKAVVTKGKLKPIICKQEKRGNKQVTIISNAKLFGLDLDKLTSMFQKTFASSCTVIEDTILVQGFRGKEITEILKKEHRIPSEYLEVVLHQPKKKKKK